MEWPELGTQGLVETMTLYYHYLTLEATTLQVHIFLIH